MNAAVFDVHGPHGDADGSLVGLEHRDDLQRRACGECNHIADHEGRRGVHVTEIHSVEGIRSDPDSDRAKHRGHFFPLATVSNPHDRLPLQRRPGELTQSSHRVDVGAANVDLEVDVRA